jgi:uncharacterized phage protein gp47/JayE
MYENETYEVILQRMLGNLSDTIDKREGSVAYDMLAPKAAELAKAYIELDNVVKFGFPQTTYGVFLDNKAAESGIYRLLSKKATGRITFTSSIENLVIPTGTVVYTDAGIRFVTDHDTTIFNGSASASITAETGGLNGNVPANSIINTELADVTCINDSPTTEGDDVESDEKFLKRYLETVQTPVVSGNTNHYRQWAKEIKGIGDARVIPLWNGNGTVKILLVSTDKKSVTSGKVTEVFDYIESVKPVGATVTVQSAVERSISVTATLELNINYSIADVKPLIEKEIIEYFKTASFVDADIKYTRIGTIILGVQGVLDYSNLKINNTTANILLGENETPVLGTVTLS